MLSKKVRPRAGASLAQVIVVVAAFLVALGLLVVWVSQSRMNVRNGVSFFEASNLRQLANAVNMAHDQNKTIPPYFGSYGGKSTGTFHYHLLPFLDNTKGWNASDPNAVVPEFLSTIDPSQRDGGAGAANYVVNARLFYGDGGLGEFQEVPKPIKLQWKEVTDGTSNTLLFATKYHVCGTNGGSLWSDPGKNVPNSPTAATFGVSMGLFQAAPTKEACNPLAGTAVSFNPKLMRVVFCDVAVHQVTTDISPATWKALHTYAGNDIVNPNDID